MTGQLGIELTGSSPSSPKEGVHIKSRLAFEHVVNRPCQFMCEDREGFALAVFFFQSGQ